VKTWINIFWLGTKELRSVLGDGVMVALIIWSLSFSIYSQATAESETVNDASVAIVDEDRSTLSRAIANALYPPYFKTPELISPAEIDESMDLDRFMFVLAIPPSFEEDVRRGRQPSVQINIDATAVGQASLGNSYIQSIVRKEVNYLLMMMVILPMMMLSGGMTPIESQPEIIQPRTWFLPSRHHMAFAQAVVFRGAAFDIIWPQLLTIIGLGSIFFTASIALFRRSITASR
jgi:hypothetical protein